MTTIKVINDTDVGTTLDISSGKLEAAASMTTDAELAAQATTQAAVDAAQNQAMVDAIAAQDALEDAAEETTRLRNAFIKRAQQVLSSESIFEVSPAGFKFYPDPAMSLSRLLVIGAGKGVNSLSAGYLNIHPPVAGDVIKGLGIPDVIVDVNGFIPVPTHGTLYFKLPAPNAHSSAVGDWYVSLYGSNDYDVPDDFLFICQQLPNNPGGMYQLFDGRKLAQGKNYGDTNWIDMTPYFAAGVSNYASGYSLGRFRRANNRVYLEGLITLPSVGFNGVFATLPDAFRPLLRSITARGALSGSVRVDISPTGDIYISDNSSSPWVSLDGINLGLN